MDLDYIEIFSINPWVVTSDITKLPALNKLTFLLSDYENPISVAEAKRLFLSKNLEEILIDNAESKEVFEILRKLPKIKELKVSVTNPDGEEVLYAFPESKKYR